MSINGWPELYAAKPTAKGITLSKTESMTINTERQLIGNCIECQQQITSSMQQVV